MCSEHCKQNVPVASGRAFLMISSAVIAASHCSLSVRTAETIYPKTHATALNVASSAAGDVKV